MLATFSLIVGLELVLGIDNILLISIITDRVNEQARNKVRFLGLGLALAARLLLLLGASFLVKLDEPIISGLSYKGLVLILGGAFLLYKAVKEIHHTVESQAVELDSEKKPRMSFAEALIQILVLDIVFSIDSIITAVGLTDNLLVIYLAVIVSFIVVLIFSGAIASFIHKNATVKILALSFLITIGVTLVVEGLGGHVPKAYIYLPMGFALAVELLQLRFQHNQSKK